jgi:hypothetical protein
MDVLRLRLGVLPMMDDLETMDDGIEDLSFVLPDSVKSSGVGYESKMEVRSSVGQMEAFCR